MSADGGQRTPSPQTNNETTNMYSYESEFYAGVIIRWGVSIVKRAYIMLHD